MVFFAEDTQLGRPVALKVMSRAAATKPNARDRFLREAKSAAAIKHDHVVTIYQVGEDHDIPYLAMELLDGESLEERLRHDPAPEIAEVIRIGRETAFGLAAAHGRGLIHRDIKPANIWLEAQGRPAPGVPRVKILDFGLARTAADDLHLTQEGAVVGTPGYLAPEQASGLALDHRCDLFSLGCLLYRMAVGRPPFRGRDLLSSLKALATEQPVAPHTLNPQVPAALSALILRLLAKEPEKRPASADEVARELEAIERSLRERAARRPRWPVLVGAAMVPALLLLMGMLVIRIPTDKGTLVIEADDATFEVVVKKNGAVVRDRTSDREMVLSVGEYEIEVYDPKQGLRFKTDKVTIERNKRELFVARLEKKTAPPVAALKPWQPGPAENVISGILSRPAKLPGMGRWQVETQWPRVWNWSFAVSADGKLAACSGGHGDVRVYEVATGMLQRILLAPSYMSNFRVAWGKDHELLAMTEAHLSTVLIWNADSGKLQRRIDTGINARTHFLPLVATSDGQHVATEASPDGESVQLWDAQTGKKGLHLRGDAKGLLRWLSFTRDGKKLAVSQDKFLTIYSTEDGKPLFFLKKDFGIITCTAWNPEGTRLAVVCGDRKLRILDQDGKLTPLPEGNANRAEDAPASFLSWSPSGRWITCMTRDDKGHRMLCWEIPANKLGPQRSVDSRGGGVAWLPDGERLLICEPSGISEWTPGDPDKARVLTYSRQLTSTAWSPDGGRIAIGTSDGNARILKVATGMPGPASVPTRHVPMKSPQNQ